MKWAALSRSLSKIGQRKSVHWRLIRSVLKENVIDFCVLLMRETLGPVRGSPALVHSPYLTSPMSTININIYSQCEQTIYNIYIFISNKNIFYSNVLMTTSHNSIFILWSKLMIVDRNYNNYKIYNYFTLSLLGVGMKRTKIFFGF